MTYKGVFKDAVFPSLDREARVARYRQVLSESRGRITVVIHLRHETPPCRYQLGSEREFDVVINRINLALLEIDSREFATADDRNLAQRAVFADVMAKRGLRDRREAMLCHDNSALVANRPIMTSLFDYVELKALCMLRVAPSLVDRFIAVKRDNPAFGLGEIMAVANEARERHHWGHYWQD